MKRIFFIMFLFAITQLLMASCSNEGLFSMDEPVLSEPSGQTKTIVAYFSATGNTHTVAQRIAELTGADIYRIEPVRKYADNPYDDSQLIQNEAYNDLRPEVANLLPAEEMARYDTVIGNIRWNSINFFPGNTIIIANTNSSNPIKLSIPFTS
jgi:hypothetical protein